MALWYTSNVFESSLNNLKLFFRMPSNSNRIIQSFILKQKQVLMRAYCFLACSGPVENLLQVAEMKNWVKERKEKTNFCMIYMIMNINNCEGKVKVKFVFTFYFMGF